MKTYLHLLFFSALLICMSSCKKNTESTGQGAIPENSSNVLSLSSAQITELREAYVRSKNLYANQYGKIRSFASVMKAADASGTSAFNRSLNEILDDDFIASLINEKGEIIVDGKLYKVTVFGTFKTSLDNRVKMDTVLNQLYKKYDTKSIKVDRPRFDLSKYYKNGVASIRRASPESSLAKVPAGPNCGPVESVELMNDVDYIPTFNSDEFQCPEEGGGGGPANPPTPSYPALLGHPMFYSENMITENMVNPEGSFWTTMFVNSTLYNYFDNEYRTSVLFYNRNYGFAKTLGIKVKHQKDGLLWWNATTASEIAAGWELISYESISDYNQKKYYATVYPAQSHYYNTDILPDDIQIIRLQNSGGEFLMPLIVTNGLPIPDVYKSQGKKGIINFIWDLIKKKMEGKPRDQWSGIPIINKDGSDTYQKILNSSDLNNRKLGAIVANGKGELEFILGPYVQFAYNDDKIDIPLDDYYSDFLTAGTLIIKAAFDPGQGGSALFNFTKDEFDKSFKVTAANVFGASTRNGMWRGVRVMHN